MWRAFYADGRTFDGHDVDRWVTLPRTGIVGVVLFVSPTSNQLVQGGDWYWYDGKPTCGDTHEEFGEWLDPPVDVPVHLLRKSARALSPNDWDEMKSDMLRSTP